MFLFQKVREEKYYNLSDHCCEIVFLTVHKFSITFLLPVKREFNKCSINVEHGRISRECCWRNEEDFMVNR